MVNLSGRDQQIYQKVLGTKAKSMTVEALYTEFASVPKAQIMASCSALLKQRLFQADKDKNGAPTMRAKTLDDTKKADGLSHDQKLVLNCVREAQRNGISLAGLKKKVAVVSMNPVLLRKALEHLVKNGNVKTFKPINSPTMSMYILAHLTPPEEVTGGVWYNANQGYDTSLVESLCQVLLKRTSDLSFPKSANGDEAGDNKAIFPFAKARLPSPHSLLNWIKDKRLTTAPLTVKNVMECMRALELDGKVETIKPLSMGHFDMGGDDEPGPSKRRKVDADGSDDESEDDVRKEKEKQKAKERAKEKKRKAKEKEKKEKKRKEKEKARRKKEKEREKRKKRKKDKKKKKADSEEDDNDSDDLREIDDEAPKKRKRRRSPTASSSSSSSSDSESDSDTDSDSGSDSDSEVSSVDSEDIDDGDVGFKPMSSMLPMTMSNPFDLSDTQIVYRATRRLGNSILLGQMQTPCGHCPQFTFCEESGPVNATGCEYYDSWLIDKEGGGGWDRGGALDKMRPGLKEDDEEVAHTAAAVNANTTVAAEQADGEANGLYDEGMEVDGGEAEYAEDDQDGGEAYDE